MLADVEKHRNRAGFGYQHRLPWCWTEEAAPWISQQLGLLVFHIVGVVWGIALCWCWQCLLTVGGNLLTHIVTPLDITTVVWCSRQTLEVLHPAECPPVAVLTSEWQWTSSVFNTWNYSGSSCSLFTEDNCFQEYPSLRFSCGNVYNMCVIWYSASYR